jgi:hypothetical protein
VVGMPGCLPCRPSPSASTTSVSTHPSGSRCPAVRCPAVRCPDIWLPRLRSLCPAVWCPARPASSLSRVQPSGVRPSARRIRRVPRQPGGGALGDTLVRRGNPHAWNESSSMWSGPVPAARSMARVGLDAGTAAEVVCRPAGERLPRTWPGCARAGWLRPTDQGGQTAARAPIASDCARQGCWLKRDVPAPAAWLPPWLERDYSPWLSWSLTPAWTGSAGPTSLTARMGARPQRGPGVQGVLQARRQQRFDLREWWWARQGLNL